MEFQENTMKFRSPFTRAMMGRPVVTLALTSAALFLVVLGCGEAKPPPAEYVGQWTGDDGTTITIRSNGTADYRSGGTSVSNGKLVIDDAAKTFKIGFVGLGPSYTLDKPPSGGEMTLSGVRFKKGGDSSDVRSDKKVSDSDSDPPSAKAPPDEKVQSLVKNTLLDFSDAVQKDDFSDLLARSSRPFKDSASQEKMRENFKDFIISKANFASVKDLTATFNQPPSIKRSNDYDMLVADGYFPTKPNKTKFVFKYIDEDGDWKLIGINVDTTKD